MHVCVIDLKYAEVSTAARAVLVVSLSCGQVFCVFEVHRRGVRVLHVWSTGTH